MILHTAQTCLVGPTWQEKVRTTADFRHVEDIIFRADGVVKMSQHASAPDPLDLNCRAGITDTTNTGYMLDAVEICGFSHLFLPRRT